MYCSVQAQPQFNNIENNVAPNVPVSILYKSIAGRYRPVRVADGPITARYRFIKNACCGDAFFNQKVLIFFLFLYKNIRCGYSLEVP